MSAITYEPKPDDILPRKYAFTSNVGDIAIAVQPWVQRNPRFTMEAILTLVGLRFDDKTDAKHMDGAWRRVRRALGLLGLRHNADQPHNDKPRIYYCPPQQSKVLRDVPLRIGLYGYTERPEVPEPPADQVEFCRQWIKGHCRPRSTMDPKNTVSRTCYEVEAWSRTIPAISERLQYNHVEKDFFRDSFFTVRTGSLMNAILLEGYSLKRIGESQDAKHNMSVREAGQPWKGRTPAPRRTPDEIETPVFDSEELKKSKAQKREAKAKQRLLAYLAQRKGIFDANPVREMEPFLTVTEAGRAMRIKVRGNQPPHIVVRLLRECGCVVTTLRRPAKQNPHRHWLKLRAESYRAWVRFSDMPMLWQQANWRLQEQLQKKTMEEETPDVWNAEEDDNGGVWNPDA